MFQGPAYIRVVVHDEDDPVHEVYRFPLLRYSERGNLTVKVLPFPLWLSTPIEPPC